VIGESSSIDVLAAVVVYMGHFVELILPLVYIQFDRTRQHPDIPYDSSDDNVLKMSQQPNMSDLPEDLRRALSSLTTCEVSSAGYTIA
jgi:hypothetical protein